MRKMVLVLALLLLPAICWSADEYVLVMSKEDNACQHMLKIYNEDIKKYGEVRYDEHEEFNWIKWEEKTIKLRPPSYPQNIQEIHARITFFDVNNDSKNDVVIYRESMLSSNPMDVYEIFRYEDLEMLNEVIDGATYYKKTLKSFDSESGVAVSIEDLSEKNMKMLLERMKYDIEATKNRGDKNIFIIDAGNKLHFLKFNNRIYITIEERSNAETLDIAYRLYQGSSKEWFEKGYNRPEQNSAVFEYQRNNSLKSQCIYYKKDKPAKIKGGN